MKRILLAIALLVLLVSCSYEPEEYVVDPQPYISVRNAVNNEDMWIRIWKDGDACPNEFLFLKTDKQKRWAVDGDTIYHLSIRLVTEYSAIENEGRMERIERISESNDVEILTEHRINSLAIYKDKNGYVYSFGYFD